jgi:hypothetical protein
MIIDKKAGHPLINMSFLSLFVSYKQVSSRLFPRKIFCKLTSERKSGTPVFQKTGAKKIKKM